MNDQHQKLEESSVHEEEKASPQEGARPRHRSQGSLSFEMQGDEAIEQENVEADMPIGRVCTTICLLVVGALLLVIGFFKEAKATVPAEGVPFWVIGALLLVPGGYCAYELFRAYLAKTPIERRRILNDIPDF